MSDRTLHAECERLELVRYDRAGKWFIESKQPMVPCARVTLAQAIRVAQDWSKNGGSVYLGKPGGGAFDRAFSKGRQDEDGSSGG